MNIEKLLKACEDYKHAYDEDAENKVVQELADSIHPEKYITEQTMLKLVERSDRNKGTNLENIKDEDKIIAYLFIEDILGLNTNIHNKVAPLLTSNYNYNTSHFYGEIIRQIELKYIPLIFSVYDKINNFNNALANLSKKYVCFMSEHEYTHAKYLKVYKPDFVFKNHMSLENSSSYYQNYLRFTYNNIEELGKDLPRLSRKLDQWFEFRDKMQKDIKKYSNLEEELNKDPFFAKKDGIHDIQYEFHTHALFYNVYWIEYNVYLSQKYHEKRTCFFDISGKIHFNDDEYINPFDSTKIEDIIDTIKVTNGKPYECEVTIENLPTRREADSSVIQYITDKDNSNSNCSNLYRLAKQIDSNVFLDITDSYIIKRSNDQGHGLIGIVMSVYYFDQDFDVHKFIAELKNLYYRNMLAGLAVCHADITIKELGQSNKEFVKLI